MSEFNKRLDSKNFVRGYFMDMICSDRLSHSLTGKYDPVIEIKSLFPDIQIIDNVMWDFCAAAVEDGYYSIKIIIDSYEEYTVIYDYLDDCKNCWFHYFGYDSYTKDYMDSNFIYDGSFSTIRYPLSYLEEVRNSNIMLKCLYGKRREYMKFVIVDICGYEELARICNYLSCIYNKEITFDLKYNNKYNILHISEDLSNVSATNATCAIMAPRAHKFGVDDFIEWHENKISVMPLNEYKREIADCLRNKMQLSSFKVRDLMKENDDSFPRSFNRKLSASVVATMIYEAF